MKPCQKNNGTVLENGAKEPKHYAKANVGSYDVAKAIKCLQFYAVKSNVVK